MAIKAQTIVHPTSMEGAVFQSAEAAREAVFNKICDILAAGTNQPATVIVPIAENLLKNSAHLRVLVEDHDDLDPDLVGECQFPELVMEEKILLSNEKLRELRK